MLRLAAFALAAGLFGLSACVSVLPEQEAPSALYRLTPAAGERALERNVIISEPSAARLFSGQAMVAEGSDGGLRLVPGVEWAGRLTRLMQLGLIDALNGAPQGAGTALDRLSGATGAYELAWTVSDLSLAGGQGICALDLVLLDGRTREPVARRSVRTAERAGSDTPQSRALALRAAAEACISEAAEFVASEARATE